MKKTVATLALSMVLAASMSTGALALDYEIKAPETTEYYRATDYEDVHGAQYNYGGINPAGMTLPELPYGKSSNTSIGAMERGGPPAPAIGDIGTPFTTTPDSGFLPVTLPEISGYTEVPTAAQNKFMPIEEVMRSDGSIGTLKISALDINVKVYDGETAASMKKGVGHFTDTSAWNGNISLCGHNRGSRYNIGGIKDLSIGDTIRYTTVLGTRTYKVSYIGTISATDWSHLSATADNRITIITCLANQPNLRVCVQAVQE